MVPDTHGTQSLLWAPAVLEQLKVPADIHWWTWVAKRINYRFLHYGFENYWHGTLVPAHCMVACVSAITSPRSVPSPLSHKHILVVVDWFSFKPDLFHVT